MKELITKLEAAPEGSRELNAEIWWVADPSSAWIAYCNAAVGKPGPRPDKMPSSGLGALGMCLRAPDFSRSLDAKIPGENIIEMNWDEDECSAWHEKPIRDGGGRYSVGIGHTEPLARRIAALKALEVT